MSTTGIVSRPQGLRQELRLGVVLTGGVSLAIWMGGVARELNLLLGQGTPESPQARQVRAQYQRLLDLLDVDVSVDVLSGTSAGGINAAILGMANVLDVDIGGLRELWLSEGSLGSLLRDPDETEILSLLKGDDQLLTGLNTGLRQIAGKRRADGAPARHTDVFITTTLLEGLPSRFVDDYGTVVADRDHHGLFRFSTGDLLADDAPARLALAGRCTASFPGAFEAARLPVGGGADQLHPDMRGIANTFATGYVADGGILANRPIGSAVRAVFDRPAEDEVRRLLLYIVPTAEGPTVESQSGGDPQVPLLGKSLLADLGAAMSQAITGDLAGIREHNENVRVRRDTRRLLCGLARGGSLVTPEIYSDYRRRTADRTARRLVDALLQLVEPQQIPLANLDPSTNDQSATDGADVPLDRHVNGLVDAVNARLVAELPTWQPETPLPRAELGVFAAEAAMTVALQLVNAGYAARPDLTARQRLAAVRGAIHDALPATARVTDVKPVVDEVVGAHPGLRLAVGELAEQLVERWRVAQPALDVLAGGWTTISRTLAEATPELRRLLGGTLPDLHEYVLGGGDEPDPEEVEQRLVSLHLTETALLPDHLPAEQELKLVQVSADTGTALDPARSAARDKLTGLQLHHFGAFYKGSWRANDWMWGRLDGSGWLVHVLLDPHRIVARRDLDPDPGAYAERFMATLQEMAGSPPPADVRGELRFLGAADPREALPASLPRTAIWVAAGVQRHIVEEELPCIAEQIEADHRGGAELQEPGKQFLQAERRPSADPAARLQSCRIGDEKLGGEIASPLFHYTVVKTSAVTVAALANSGYAPPVVRLLLGRLGRQLRRRTRRLHREVSTGRTGLLTRLMDPLLRRLLGRNRSAR